MSWQQSVSSRLRSITASIAALTSAVTVPAMLLFSIPLTTFAVITTILAFWILLLRASMVYAELGFALLKSCVIPEDLPKREMPPRRPVKERSPVSKRASRSSSVGSDLVMRGKNLSIVSLTESAPNRDFEGVGGWRLAGDEEEEALWMGINSRPDTSPLTMRQHRQSFSFGSHAPSGNVSPERIRTPMRVRPPSITTRPRSSGTASPEDYFTVPLSRSTPALDNAERQSRVSFHPHSRSGSSSTASMGSVAMTAKPQAP